MAKFSLGTLLETLLIGCSAYMNSSKRNKKCIGG